MCQHEEPAARRGAPPSKVLGSVSDHSPSVSISMAARSPPLLELCQEQRPSTRMEEVCG